MARGSHIYLINQIQNLRTYGKQPFSVAVIHGGPGAPGHMAPVARELAAEWGVLEPLQTATSLEGQVQELRAVLEENGELPVILVGSSWGAMLGFILTARYPALVKKLILVGSGVYEEQYATEIEETRMSRLSEEERATVASLTEALGDPANTDKNATMAQLGKLFTGCDAYNPITLDTENLEVQYDTFVGVWGDAKEQRRASATWRAYTMPCRCSWRHWCHCRRHWRCSWPNWCWSWPNRRCCRRHWRRCWQHGGDCWRRVSTAPATTSTEGWRIRWRRLRSLRSRRCRRQGRRRCRRCSRYWSSRWRGGWQWRRCSRWHGCHSRRGN